MEKYFLIGLTILLVLGFSTVSSFATEITQENIDEGVKFCKEYPVSLFLGNEEITFDETQTPPVIITPEGEENGRTLIPARAIFEKAGGNVVWDEEQSKVEILYNNTRIELFIGNETAYVNGEACQLEVPAFIIDHDGDYFGSTMIPVRFAAESLDFNIDWNPETRTIVVTVPEVEEEPNRGDVSGREDPDDGSAEGIFPVYERGELPKATEGAAEKLIVLDFGHGGRDPGAMINEGKEDEICEKDINYAAGMALYGYLKDAGMNVYLLKDDDSYMNKYERARIANELNADFFVSVHNNSSVSSTPKGTEVLYYAKINEAGLGETAAYGISSSFVAKYVQAEMVSALGTIDRGVTNKPSLAVLNKTNMPAIVIEGAFLSNPEDLKKMLHEEYADRYAYAAAKGIINAFNEKFEKLSDEHSDEEI